MYIIAELLRRQRKKKEDEEGTFFLPLFTTALRDATKTHNFFVSFIILSIVQQYKKKKFIRDVSNL